MLYNRNRLFPKYAERLIRIMENKSHVLAKQPATTLVREGEEKLESY